jgi:DNA excision repair protein ERCC-4
VRLVSPTDAPLGRLLGAHISSLPEQYGADVLSCGSAGLIGWQRKEIKDLVASAEDGRLAREVPLLALLPYPVLIVEGDYYYTADGKVIDQYQGRWTKAMIRNLLRSVQHEYGVMVERTRDIEDTAIAITELEAWAQKSSHRSIERRPQDSGGQWREKSRETWGKYFLQGFPGIGVERAEAIYRHFGRVPLMWSVEEGELRQVPGVGREGAKRLWERLNC